MNNKVLIVDDEPDVVRLVANSLACNGFQIFTASDGPTAITIARDEEPGLIILDIVMPGMSGFEVTRALKGDNSTVQIPILILSARNEEVDRVTGFELGVDDFVSKPFSPRELVLRAKAIMSRRSRTSDEGQLFRCGEITVDTQRHEVSFRNQVIHLTMTEFKILAELMSASGRVVTREDLLGLVWGKERTLDVRTVDTHLRRLRERLGVAAAQIQTVRGFGYRIEGRTPAGV